MKEAKTIYEQIGGTYREENGSLVPDMELPEQKPIGKYGRMHLEYLKQHRRGRYSALLGEERPRSRGEPRSNRLISSLPSYTHIRRSSRP